MSDDRLPTKLWVDAHIRRCDTQSIPIYVIQKGEDSRGVVMVKIVISMRECKLFTQMRDMDGKMVWINAFESDIVTEAEADQRIAQEKQYDPDLWVIEVESRDGTNPLEDDL